MGLDDAAHLRGVGVDDGVAPGGDAGVVDEDGDGAEVREGGGGHGLALLVVGDVGLVGVGAAAEGADFLGECVGGVGVAGVVDGDVCACGGEGADDAGADAAATAGDECGASGEICHVGAPGLLRVLMKYAPLVGRGAQSIGATREEREGARTAWEAKPMRHGLYPRFPMMITVRPLAGEGRRSRSGRDNCRFDGLVSENQY